MATYIQGLTDYIPQIQPFKPDLNMYSKVLQMKQDKYDAAKREIGSLYGSLLYSPLTRQDNIKRRDDFFKNIEQQIKKISSMDLSLAQNQDAAMKIFDPIINDRNISHDWAFTKNVMSELQRADSFRYCTDPKKCGGAYSPESVTFLNMKLDEYAKADQGIAMSMNMSDVKFAPFHNIQKDAIDWAKATGFLVEEAGMMGGYIVKKQNGQTIKVPLMQLFLSTFGNDPKYRMHYQQLAYINKRNWINEKLEEYNNDPIVTEKAYYNDVINNTVKSLQTDADEYDKIHDEVSVRNKAMRNRVANNGVIADDKSSIAEILNAQEDDMISQEAKGYYDDLRQRISNLSINQDDIPAFGAMMESIVADGFLKMDLAKATEELAAVWNTTTDIKENQFSLNAQRHQHAVDEMKLKFKLDDEAAINARLYDIAKETALKFNEGGLPSNNEGTPEEGIQVKPGEADIYGISQGKSEEYKKTVYGNQRQYNAIVINTLRSIANQQGLSPEERKLARNELKSMLGNFYDEVNNVFVNGNAKYDNYSDLVLDGKNEYTVYQNAKKVMSRNQGNLLRPIVNATSTISEETDQIAMMRDGYGEILTKNNKLIRDASASVKDVGDPILFNGMFVDSPDGSVNVITNEDEYVKKMMGTKFNKTMSPESKEKVLRKAYKENFKLYKEMYNNGPEYGISGIEAPNGMGLGTGIDGNARVEGRSWNSNYSSPNSYPNQGFHSFMKDVDKNKSSTKALLGTRHTADEYDTDDDRGARVIFNMYRQDLLSGKYATDGSKQTAPMAKVTYFDMGGEGMDKVSVSLTDINPEWLKSIATDDKKTMIQGTSIDKVIENGVTMYLSKEVANNLFTRNFKEKPGDVYINSGRTWSVSRPDGGNVSIKKVSNMIMVDGYLVGYDAEGNRRNISVANSIDARQISGASLINQYTTLLNDQQDANISFMETGNLPRIYDEATLMKELQMRMSPGGKETVTRMNNFRSLIGQ